MLIEFDGREGCAIRDIAVQMGVDAANGAIRYLKASSGEQIFQTATRAQIEGTLRIWALQNALDRESSASARDAARRLVKQTSEIAQQHHEHLEEVEASHKNALLQFERDLENALKQFAEDRAQVASDIEGDRGRWQEEWETQRALYIEQLKLKAAVSEWADRATSHERSFRKQRGWIIAIGLLGVVVAILWSWGALSLAHWLFADALVQGNAAPASGTLRPTWIHELIFAASASLLYLTMFLWTMRVLVRMMMSEHHLGVDARSRASMAHTYLALLEDKGANEDADRAIVLAALFRPVTDGLIKDDAMPLISPASILSGKLAGG